MTQDNKPDAVEEIKDKAFEKFKEWFRRWHPNFTYEYPLSLEDETLIRIAISFTVEKIKEETGNYRKQLVVKSSENPMKDMLINTGKILALKDIGEILAEFGVSEKGNINTLVKKDSLYLDSSENTSEQDKK